MTRAELLIIGAGPAGHAAAEAYREHNGSGRVVLLSAESRLPYRRPPLSKELLRGELGEDELPIESPAWYADRAIEVRHSSAIGLDTEARTVSLSDDETIEYETAILATGAQPVLPPVPGVDLDGVEVLRSADHALTIRARASAGKRVVIVGSGFIGCEAAASLRRLGCSVELISQEAAPQKERLGEEVAGRIERWLAADGVQGHYGVTLEAIERAGSALSVLTSKATLAADMVLLASGVRAATDLAREAGFDLTEKGHVPAGEDMRTVVPGVFACGDCCRARHSVAGRPLHVEHWGDALSQGKIAGTVAAGGDAIWEDVPGFWSGIGDRTLKFAAWGDGYDTVRVVDHDGGAFTAWYERDGACVGVLTHNRDSDYEDGREAVFSAARS